MGQIQQKLQRQEQFSRQEVYRRQNKTIKPKNVQTPRQYGQQHKLDESKRRAVEMCRQDGSALQNVAKEFQSDKDVVIVACNQDGLSLKFAAKELQNDRAIVIAACNQNGMGLQFASPFLQSDKEIVLVACSSNGQALKFASDDLRADKDVALHACNEDGFAIKHASETLQEDRDVVFAACQQDWRTLLIGELVKYRIDKEFILAACQQHGMAILRSTQEFNADKDVGLVACHQNGLVLRHLSEDLRADRDVVLTACVQNGEALQYASQELRDDIEIVMLACRNYGNALRFASDPLRSNKDVVLAAATSEPESLKYAMGGLNQDADCLVKAKLWDESRNVGGSIKIALSTKFALDATSSSRATQFTVRLKQHPYIRDGNFDVYSPNAFRKQTCDPEWTRLEWPCRGTYETCQKEVSFKTGAPSSDSCWRYSFRYQLGLAKSTNGFMVQVVDYDENVGQRILGKGQTIETEMAGEVGTKIFRIYQPTTFFYSESIKYFISRKFRHDDMAKLESHLKRWYQNDCQDMSEVEIL